MISEVIQIITLVTISRYPKQAKEYLFREDYQIFMSFVFFWLDMVCWGFVVLVG